MAYMSVEEWRKKKAEESKQGTSQSSATESVSNATTKTSPTSEKTSYGSSGYMSVEEWRNKKKTGDSTTTGFRSKSAVDGWNKYLADQKKKKEAEENKPWYEKLGEWLGQASDTTLPTATTTTVINNYRNDTSYREPNRNWSDSQRDEFGSLYNESPTKAYEYAKKVNNSIAQAEDEKQTAAVKKKALSNPVGHTAGAILTAPLGLADYLDNLAELNARGEVTEKPGLTPFDYSQTVTSSIGENLNEKHGTLNEDIPIIGGKGWGDVYGLGTSIAQSALAGYTGGQFGTLVQFFGSAAASGFDDAKQRGASDQQAMQIGTLNGIAEGLAESIGIDNLLKIGSATTMRGLLKNIAKQGAAEGLEEGVTTLLNNFADQLVMQDKSNFYNIVNQLVANGVPMEQAKKQAWLMMANDMAFDMVGGFVSGSVHAGPQTAFQTVIENVYQPYQTGKYIMESDGSVDALKQLANDIAGASSEDMQKTISDQIGKVDDKQSALQVGKLYNTVQSANNQANASANQADIAKSLERKGFTAQEAKTAAEAIVAKYNGQELTDAQKKTIKSIKGNEAVQGVLDNIINNSKSTMGQRSDNIRNFNRDVNFGRIAKANGISTEDAKKIAEGKFITAKENGSESHYKVSTDGQTIDKDGNTVSIQGIASLENGHLVLKTENGTVNAGDVTYGSQAEALVYEAVSNLEGIIDTDTANRLAKHLMKLGEVKSDVYARGIVQAYTYGYYGYGREAMLGKNTLSATLAEKQRNVAYGLGEQFSKAKTDADQANARNATIQKKAQTSKDTAPDGTKYQNVVFDSKIKKWGKKQKAEVAYIDFIASNFSGNTVHVFESYKTKDGYFYEDINGKIKAAPNGMYIAETGDIYLDLNAGNHGEGLVMNTFAHELYHHIQKRSPEKARKLAEFLVQELGYESVELAVRRQIAKAEAAGHGVEYLMKTEGLSRNAAERMVYDRAFNDFVADSLETMFTEGDAVGKLQKLKSQDEGLFNMIKDFINKWVKKLREFYNSHSTISIEGDMVRQLEKFDQIQQMFVEALVDAGENFKSLATMEENTDAVPVESVTEYSYRSLAEAAGFEAVENDDGRFFTRNGARVSEVTVDDIENSPIGAMINYSLSKNDITAEDAKRQKQMFADICTMACQTNDFAMTMQFVGSAVFTGMKANADKQYGTTYDFPSICTKTQAVIDAMSKRMVKLGRGLSSEELVKLYQDVFASGNPVPCPECYVFSRWIGIGGLLDNIKKYQDYYGDMDVEDVAKAYRTMRDEVAAFAEEQGISFGKAKGALTSKLTKEYNKLTEKIEKAQNQGEKVKPADQKRLDELEPMMNTVKGMTWLENVYFADSSLKKVNPRFRVPNEVLFDLNNGEAFATQYKEAWAFRTTQGAGYGKAITPYAEARLGEGILVTNNTTNAIKGKAQGSLDNIFLKQKGTLDKKAREALDRARLKQKIQAFIGGQRFQSTSDARYENASDYLLAALEMQAMHGMVQVYTKVDGAVPALATWNYSINQSLMPLGGGLDADGNVRDTSVGGMNRDIAFRNRDKFETAGTITIGVNDNHIRAMFKQWVRDFIIPYHASGGKADVVAAFRSIQEGQEKRGQMVRSTDYSRTQSDKVLSDDVLRWQGKTEAEIQRIHEVRAARIAILTGGKPNMDVVRSNRFLSALYDKLAKGGEWEGVKLAKSKVESQIYPNEFWDQTVSYEDSGKITRDYLDYCNDLGFLHRFSGMVPSNGKLVPVKGYDQNGNRVVLTDLAYKYDENGQKTDQIEEYFWKVLTDRRMYDNQRKYLPQKVVNLNDTTTDTVTTFAKGNYGRQYDKALSMSTAEKIAGKMYSDRDSDGNHLTKQQQEFFKDSKVRDENGNLIPMYHGTNNPDFTVFDPDKSDDHISLFFTSDPDVANTYTHLQDKGRDVDPYNLITKDSSAEQFNKAQEKIGGGLRVVKITPEWIQEMKEKAEKSTTRLFGIANKYADLLAYNNSTGMFNYDIDRIRDVTSKGIENLTVDGINKLRKAMGDAEQHSFFARDHRNAAGEIRRIYHNNYDLFNEVLTYKTVANTPRSAIGHYTYTETNSMVSYTIGRGTTFEGHLKPMTEKEAVGQAIERMQFVDEHHLGNRYKVYLNITNPYVIDASITYSGKMDSVSLEGGYNGDGWTVNFENDDIDVTKYMSTSEFTSFVETAFDAETSEEIKTQMEANNEGHRQSWPEFDFDPSDVYHKIYLEDVNINYIEPGNWNALNFNGKENAKTREVTAWAKEKGYDGVIFKNMKDAGGYAFKKGRGGSTVAAAFSSEQVKSVENKTPTDDPDIRYSDRVLMGSLFSGGGTLEAGLVYQMLDKEFAVEYNKQIAATYTDNHGKEHMFVGDVRDFNSKDKQNVFYLHASPVCKNFSPASHSGGETTLDIVTAQATARVLEEQMPQVFTVENVKRYVGSEAYTIITDKLTELGYKWDVGVYKASDYGNATKRERMIIRAVKDGELPPKPAKVSGITSWGEATRDLWETDLIPSTLVKSKIEAIRNTPALKNLKLTKLDRPLMIYDTNKSKQATYAWADELAPTLTTKCGDARIIMPDGKVYAPTPKFMGRIQGLPDDYKYPKAKTNAFKIIGNGIPTQLTKAVIGGVLDSAYEQTHDGQKFYSDRDTESISNRSLLANAFEGVAQNDIEKNKIQEYKSKISLIEAEERKLQELNEKIKELSFSKGPRDTKAIRDLQFEAKQTSNRINTYDKQLLRLEASKPLQDVIAREKKVAYQRAEKKGKEALAAYKEKAAKTQRELLNKYQDARKTAVENREKTAMRHKVQNVVKELNDLLLNESKKRHVPDNLKKAVADALALVNMDTVGAEERAAKYAALIAKETDPDKIDAYTVTMENILRQGDKMGQRLKELRDAYEEIQESDDPDIANAYDPVIAGALKELSGSIGNTSLRNMTIEQLSDVYDMYKMVLTRVRDANKTLLENIKENISSLASRVIGEVRMTGGDHKYRAAVLDTVRKFLWNNLKPVYAMEHIGSSTLTKVFNNVRAGEDTWAKDVTEAREYYLDKAKKYGYNGWDFKKKHRFKSASEQEFELTLEQILSLYAYSKREQAHEHLKLGGFVFDSNIETYKDKDSKILKYKVNTADAHQITPEILASIIGKLSKEQMAFVDEMQDYLSTVMGAKGNEVTKKMYGVKLFKEKFYFPLKSAKQFMFEQNEVSGEVKIKNSGFTNKVVAKANNPIILSNFMDVWSGHVNDMSMYHSFVLPLEDFNRVFNYNSPKKENQPSVSVKGTIQNAYSPAAVNYVKNLITDLNGGTRTDPAADIPNKWMGKFKKGAVFASLSVVVQQPSAIARAAALVDTKYFIGPKVDHKRHKALWDEVKQYAPVAIIKEMGYFDTNMGKSTQDFILGQEYSGFKEKMKALVTDSGYRDEVLSKAPALADEIAWCAIWEAVKRETKAQYKGLDVKSEPFLMLAGSRFTEVITKTQVYDSVLSRSANMRSKDTVMKMATAFMAEPTTSINMIADALLQGKRGNKKYARAAIGAVIASQIFNSILVSFVYAGRDDDEDESYWEKYIGTLSGEIIDGLNPAGYIPFIKDIQSIVQGYDVERSDMAVISDLVNAYQKLGSDNLSVYRKVESFAGSIAQLFGLPVKNIMRDARGIYQTIDSFMNGPETTVTGIGYAVKSTAPKWLGGGEVSDKNQLYEAMVSGDKDHIARVKGRFKDASAVNSAIRMGLRENDPRINQAAIAWNANDLDKYMRIAKEIIAEKHFSQDDVVMAIRAEAEKLKPDEASSTTAKAKGLFTAEKFAEAIAQGDSAMANAIKTDIIKTEQKNGKDADAAAKSFNSSAKSELKEMYLAGEISKQKVVNALTTYCGADEDSAWADVQYWEFKQKYPNVYADDSWFDAYYADVADSGMDIGLYMEYRNTVKDITGTGKKERRMAVIHSMPISNAQKDALYYAEGWAASRIGEAPWH